MTPPTPVYQLADSGLYTLHPPGRYSIEQAARALVVARVMEGLFDSPRMFLLLEPPKATSNHPHPDTGY
jgi:hypothetical protein